MSTPPRPQRTTSAPASPHTPPGQMDLTSITTALYPVRANSSARRIPADHIPVPFTQLTPSDLQISPREEGNGSGGGGGASRTIIVPNEEPATHPLCTGNDDPIFFTDPFFKADVSNFMRATAASLHSSNASRVRRSNSNTQTRRLMPSYRPEDDDLAVWRARNGREEGSASKENGKGKGPQEGEGSGPGEKGERGE